MTDDVGYECSGLKEKLLLGWAVAVVSLMYFLIPLAFLWNYRKVRFLATRNVPLCVEVVLAITPLGVSFVISLFGLEWLPCDLINSLVFIAGGKVGIPFILLYRHFYSRLRYGAQIESMSSQLLHGVMPLKSKRKKSWWLRMSLDLVAKNPNFPFWARISDVALFVLQVAIFSVLHIRKPKIVWDISMCRLNYVPAIIFFTVIGIHLGFALPTMMETARLGQGSDRLGLRRALRSLNLQTAVFICICGVLQVVEIARIKPLPLRWHLLIGGSSFGLHFVLVLEPLYSFWKNKDQHSFQVDVKIDSELRLLEQYICSDRGFQRLLPFFQEEFCVESLLFIRDAGLFENSLRIEESKQPKTPLSKMMMMVKMGDTTRSIDSAATVLSERAQFSENAMRIFKKFVDVNATHGINSEYKLLENCRSEFQKLFPPQRKRSTLNGGKIVPEKDFSPQGRSVPQKTLTSFKELFHDLKEDQLQILFMDQFARCLQASPSHRASWNEFKETQLEMDIFMPPQKQDNKRISESEAPQSILE